MKQKRPATQAGVGVSATALRMPTITPMAAANIVALLAQIRAAMPRCAGRCLHA
jgi:hypothetical protein